MKHELNEFLLRANLHFFSLRYVVIDVWFYMVSFLSLIEKSESVWHTWVKAVRWSLWKTPLKPAQALSGQGTTGGLPWGNILWFCCGGISLKAQHGWYRTHSRRTGHSQRQGGHLPCTTAQLHWTGRHLWWTEEELLKDVHIIISGTC